MRVRNLWLFTFPDRVPRHQQPPAQLPMLKRDPMTHTTGKWPSYFQSSKKGKTKKPYQMGHSPIYPPTSKGILVLQTTILSSGRNFPTGPTQTNLRMGRSPRKRCGCRLGENIYIYPCILNLHKVFRRYVQRHQ